MAFARVAFLILALLGVGSTASTDRDGTTLLQSAVVAKEGAVDGTCGFETYTSLIKRYCSAWFSQTGSGYDFTWTRQSGSTPSSGTGPTGAAEGSNYMFIEASGKVQGDKARLFTSDLGLTVETVMSFEYHMWGEDGCVGQLKIYLDGSLKQIESGTQGTAWKKDTIFLPSGTDTVLFAGVVGSCYKSDICLDDIQFEMAATDCSFESSNLCDGFWRQFTTTDDMDWTRGSGSTPSTSTGPSSPAQGLSYLFMESSGQTEGDTAVLMSKPVWLNMEGDKIMTFKYHMYGACMGTLKVSVQGNVRFTKSGDQGDEWKTGTVSFSNGDWIKFTGIRGCSHASDMAIDDIRFEVQTTATTTTTGTVTTTVKTFDGPAAVVSGVTQVATQVATTGTVTTTVKTFDGPAVVSGATQETSTATTTAAITTTTTTIRKEELNLGVVIKNVDYSLVMADPVVEAALKEQILQSSKDSLAAANGGEAPADEDITVTLSAGSIKANVQLQILPDPTLSEAEREAALTAARERATTAFTEPAFAESVVTNVKSIPTIAAVATGPIETVPVVEIGGALPDYCTKVFLDLGASIGVQVRKMMEPQKYPGARIIEFFDQYLGGVDERSKASTVSGICSVMVEPNPSLYERLATVVSSYSDHKIILWDSLASTASASSVPFWIDERPRVLMYGSSTRHWTDPMREITVKAEAIDKIIPATALAQLDSLFIKMDVEGDEYVLLPYMLANDMLCNSKVKIGILWHKNFREAAEPTMDDIMTSIQTKCGDEKAQFFHLDDETYLKDGQPFEAANA